MAWNLHSPKAKTVTAMTVLLALGLVLQAPGGVEPAEALPPLVSQVHFSGLVPWTWSPGLFRESGLLQGTLNCDGPTGPCHDDLGGDFEFNGASVVICAWEDPDEPQGTYAKAQLVSVGWCDESAGLGITPIPENVTEPPLVCTATASFVSLDGTRGGTPIVTEPEKIIYHGLCVRVII